MVVDANIELVVFGTIPPSSVLSSTSGPSDVSSILDSVVSSIGLVEDRVELSTGEVDGCAVASVETDGWVAAAVETDGWVVASVETDGWVVAAVANVD